MYTLEQQIDSLADAFIESFPKIAREIADDYGYDVIGQYSPSGLRVQSGNLIGSFQVGNANNIFEVEANAGVARLKIGSALEYAAIQNFGGSIPATEAMTRFFWAMWFQKKEDKWKWMALHTAKGMPIIIPAHHYLDASEKQFQAEMEQLLKANNEALLQQLIDEMSGEKIAEIRN